MPDCPDLAQRIDGLVHRANSSCLVQDLRPFRVFLVWLRWSGGVRGAGTRSVALEQEMTPTPVVSPFLDIANVINASGSSEVGTLRLQSVSPLYTEAQLRGQYGATPEESPFPADLEFFYEVQRKSTGGTSELRRRFTLMGPPEYSEGTRTWTLRLRRVLGDRGSDGEL